VAVEQTAVNPNGKSNTAPIATELPAGMQMEKVFGSPATGTADEFLEALGVMLLVSGIILVVFLQGVGAPS
jgi:hypothetical protein